MQAETTHAHDRPRAPWRLRLDAFVESPRVQRTVIALIVLNAVTLGLETSPAVRGAIGPLLAGFDRAVLAVFVLEIALKLLAKGGRFFRDGWNLFDFAIVGIALVPATGPFSVLRALRVLRVLRLVSNLPRLRFVIEAMLHALPGLGAIAGLLALIFYVSAVIATNLFGADHPDWFGSLPESLYTLFQLMTLDSWSSGVARPVMEVHPWAWLFFVPFILMATFVMLNLFVAVIVNTMQEMQSARERREAATAAALGAEAAAPADAAVLAELRALREELAALRRALPGAEGGR